MLHGTYAARFDAHQSEVTALERWCVDFLEGTPRWSTTMSRLHYFGSGLALTASPNLALRKERWLTGITMLAAVLSFATASAEAPSITVAYQPMVSTGLAAGQPFEAWLVLDKSLDPTVPGYAVPAGATIRFVFPKAFTPRSGLFQGAVMLYGWSQGSIAVKFTTAQDRADPRAFVIRCDEPIVAGPPERPGLKAIHLRLRVINPRTAGDYPVAVEFTNAGPLSETSKATVHITSHPVPNVAAYNELNHGRGSDWQHVKAGQEVSIPIDFLVTLPNISRSVVSLLPRPDRHLNILSDGKPIGVIRTHGVPVTLTTEAFGPGYARLGIIRVRAKAGSQAGNAEIVANLYGGTQCTINLVVE
jgi:hypothetical protein